MDWYKLIFEIFIIPALGILAKYLISYLQVKSEELQIKTNNELEKKYIELFSKTVQDCVIATNQTYVDTLKKENKFDIEAQKEAFKRTYTAVLAILSEEAKEHLNEIYQDFSGVLQATIEAQVNLLK